MTEYPTRPELSRRAQGVTGRERLLLLLAGGFVVVGGAQLAIANPAMIGLRLWGTLGLSLIAFAITHMVLNRLLPEHDPYLLPSVLLLSGWGLLLIARLAPKFLVRQGIWLFLSLSALVVIVRLGRENLRWLRRFRYTWLLGGLILLAATLVCGVNPSGYGPRLWLGGFGVYFQPSEPFKLLLISYLASYLAERHEQVLTGHRRVASGWCLPLLAYMGPLLAMIGLALVVLLWQQDLGTAMLYLLVFLVMLYIATGQWWYVGVGLGGLILLGLVGYRLSEHIALRVDAWLNPWPEAAGRAFQVVQSLQAFAAGGILGQGLGLGAPNYIPAVHTDFTFAALAEEFGLVGIIAVVALYSFLLMRGFRAAFCARAPFERFLAAGLTTAIVLQAWVIMGGNAKLIPITGVTLPFISYGGSSLFTSYVGIALLLCVSAPRQQYPHMSGAWPVARHISAGHTPRGGVETRKALERLLLILVVLMVAVASTAGYWSVVRAQTLQVRADNPRRILYEQRIVRGPIVDRNGNVLAYSVVDSDGFAARYYPAKEAAVVLGYSSIRYGTGGIEAAFDTQLRGEVDRTLWEKLEQGLLHHPPKGDTVQLTLDSDLQKRAYQLLGGRKGAIVVLDARSGEVLALVSSPSFDPEQLEDAWDHLREDPEAPLLNRATQGLYQPGAILQTLVVAEALEREAADLSTPVDSAAQMIVIDGTVLTCEMGRTARVTLGEAYAFACPGAMEYLGDLLGSQGLSGMVTRWGLTTPPVLELPTVAPVWAEEVLTSASAQHQEALGQGQLLVSPLQMALVAATVANEGTMPEPRLAMAIPGHSAAGHEAKRILSPRTAQIVRTTWRTEEGVAFHRGIAVAGSGKAPHAWFIGVAPATDEMPRYAAAVLLEHTSNPEAVVQIGVSLLRSALEQMGQ